MKLDLSDKAKKWVGLFLVIIVVILAIALAVKLVRAFKKPSNAKYVTGGGQIPDGWSPTAITDDLYKAIQGIFTLTQTKDAAYARFNALNDNQMIAVYNDWMDRIYDKKSYFFWPMGTLTEAVKNETGYLEIGGVNNMDLMIANLDRLQLK